MARRKSDRELAEREAQRLLKKFGISKAPVDVESIASNLGLQVSYQTFDDDNVSGMLVRGEGGLQLIGVNERHAPTRQRFTVAHELGHFALHKGREMIIDQVLRVAVNLRDQTATQATDSEEIQANQFAAELLMPGDWVKQELTLIMKKARKAGSIDDVDRVVRKLARRFDVSKQAMEIRMINLRLLNHPF